MRLRLVQGALRVKAPLMSGCINIWCLINASQAYADVSSNWNSSRIVPSRWCCRAPWKHDLKKKWLKKSNIRDLNMTPAQRKIIQVLIHVNDSVSGLCYNRINISGTVNNSTPVCSSVVHYQLWSCHLKTSFVDGEPFMLNDT